MTNQIVRRRGGQPGNRNARKTLLSESLLRELAASSVYFNVLPAQRAEEHLYVARNGDGLREEIALVRTHIRDLLAQGAGTDDLLEIIELLGKLVSIDWHVRN